MRMRRANLSRFALFKIRKNSHSVCIEMKIRFLHDIPKYPINGNGTATDLKLSTFYRTRKSSVGYFCVSFLFSILVCVEFLPFCGSGHPCCLAIFELKENVIHNTVTVLF